MPNLLWIVSSFGRQSEMYSKAGWESHRKLTSKKHSSFLYGLCITSWLQVPARTSLDDGLQARRWSKPFLPQYAFGPRVLSQQQNTKAIGKEVKCLQRTYFSTYDFPRKTLEPMNTDKKWKDTKRTYKNHDVFLYTNNRCAEEEIGKTTHWQLPPRHTHTME